jgi:hypothetical protein
MKMNKCAETKNEKRDIFMFKNFPASDGIEISLPARVQVSAQPKEAGFFIYRRFLC